MPNPIVSQARFHHIALRAADFDRTVAFYTHGLGLTLFKSWGEGDGRVCMLDLGDGGCIEIFARGEAAAEPEGEFFHLAIGTSDTDGAYAAAMSAGAVSDKPPYDTTIPCDQGPLPVRIAFVKGPNGETLEFFCVRAENA
jgi:glyoxylase I family protein